VSAHEVPPEAAGWRLDRWLAALPDVGSRGAAERLLATGAVHVDGEPRGKSHKLAGGERVEFELAPAPVAPQVAPPDLSVAYSDEHLLVVDKPAGVVVHPAPGHAGGTLAQALALAGAAGGEEAERAGIVHRLDRDTSGLLVVARSQEAHERLQRLVRRRALIREYLALVVGKPRSRTGTIEAAIGRDRRDRLRHSLDTEKPRAAVTHFELEELLDGYTLLRVRLETGRTHQIRVHLEAIGLPVVLGLERQFLHAARLAFPHPITGEAVDVSSPLPPDLAGALETARRS
jgi:23S rRNA pseudouridine1911/1915/1917 synthase